MNACRSVCGPIGLSIPAASYTAHDPGRAMAVHALTVRSKEDRTVEAFADGEIDRSGGARCERDRNDLAAFAQDGEGAVPAFEAESVDIGAERFGDP
jgi:hypothetical protein